MRHEIHNGHKIVCGYIYPVEELKVGQRWMSSSNSIVTITKVENDWVTYQGEHQPEHTKDCFSFQCRYCLMVEDNV